MLFSLRCAIAFIMDEGADKHYAYYLCQTKDCEHYGQSIARDKAEQDIGNVIKTLQPTSALIAIVKAMFRDAWDQQSKTVDGLKASLKKHIQSVEEQIESILDRLLATTNETIIQRYETKISALERYKARYADQIMHLDNPNRGTYEDKLEPALQIIASPWKLWASGNVTLRRLVLKLAFADRIRYDRNKGARTANLSMPFKALDGVLGGDFIDGAAEKHFIYVEH